MAAGGPCQLDLLSYSRPSVLSPGAQLYCSSNLPGSKGKLVDQNNIKL